MRLEIIMNLFEYITEEGIKGARQSHGKDYEQKVIKTEKYISSDSHTAKFDAIQKHENYLVFFKKEIPAIDVSIKFSEYDRNRIDLADFFRVARQTKDFIMHLGFYQGSKTNIVDEYKIKIKLANFKKLLPKFTTQELDQMEKDFKEIRAVKGKVDADQHKKNVSEFKQKYKNFFSANKSAIKLAIKDSSSSSQFRIQCNVSRNKFLKEMATEENGNKVYYHKVKRSILSSLKNLFTKSS
jgi:hypothetical protein